MVRFFRATDTIAFVAYNLSDSMLSLCQVSQFCFFHSDLQLSKPVQPVMFVFAS